MAERSAASGVVILPVIIVGLVVAGIAFYPSAEAPTDLVQVTVDESRIVSQAIEQGLATLPKDSAGLGMAERHLLLRLNDSPERRLEVAGGLYAVAAKFLDGGNAPEALRVAQVCADLAPHSLIAARCWLLCGQASAVTYPDLPLSIRYYERAEKALRERLLQQPGDDQTLQALASTVQFMGHTQDRFGRTEEAIRHLRELTGETPLAQAQLPADRLRAKLTLGRLRLKMGENGPAQKMLIAAHEYGTSDSVPAVEALHALIASTQTLHPDVTDPARESAFRELWETARFRNLPEWFQVGDELTSGYFFSEPRQLADFEIVSRQLLTSLPAVLNSMPTDSDQRAALESLYAVNLLLAVDSARSRSDQIEVTRLVSLFENQFQGRDVQFTSPLDRPAQRLYHIGEIYRSAMTGHAEQLRQIQATGASPR